MHTVNRTKKNIIAGLVTAVLACTGLNSALAGPGTMQAPGGQHPCPLQGQQLDKDAIRARDSFLSETAALRKQMAEKRAAQMALMNSTNPAPEQASKLAGELFELREQLRAKATAAGLPAHLLVGRGQMACNGPRMGDRYHRKQAM